VVALRAGLVPRPAAEVWGGMAQAGVLVAAVELGLTAGWRPAGHGGRTSAELGLDPTATRLLLSACARAGT
jgi:hypothetical protein